MADVSHLDATSRMIVGGQVASEMTVQTVLSLLEVARLRRGAFHGGLSFSCDRAHFDAGREDQPSARPRAWQRSARSPPSGNRESDETARPRAWTPSTQPSSSSARDEGPEGMSLTKRPWPCRRSRGGGTRIHGSLGDPLSETGAHDFERADAAEDHTESEEGIQGTESPRKPGW